VTGAGVEVGATGGGVETGTIWSVAGTGGGNGPCQGPKHPASSSNSTTSSFQTWRLYLNISTDQFPFAGLDRELRCIAIPDS
jgi:hypothetical protein